MNLGKYTCWTILCGLPLLLAGCSGGGGGAATGTISSVVQDLSEDPNGTATVVTFSQAPGAVSASSFSSTGGQTALTATANGSSVTVTWDDRVTPTHQVSVSGVGGIINGSAAVTTSDSSVPAFTITDSSMVAGLGGDTLEVTFSGPRVVEAAAEAIGNWTLTVGSSAVDLTGSTLDLDPTTQVLSITLGSNAGLHASYTLAATSLASVADVSLSATPVAGTASGDAVAPSLLSVVQNLSEDEYGRTIDFTFDEAMDPTLTALASNFAVASPNIATQVTQPSAGLLRVTFSSPVIPGVNGVTLSNMMDTHGNAGPSGVQVVTQPSPVVNSYSASDAVTVSNQGGDYLLVTFVQALETVSASDDSNWTLVVDGNPITMADQTLTYDFAGKSLRVDLDFDMLNGTAYTLTAGSVLEVDGQSFTLASAGSVGGDAVVPTIVGVVQNRVQDPTGQTLDVTFSEDLQATAATTLGNWTVAGRTISAAVQLGTPDVVRLTLTGGAAVPGTQTLDIANQVDLAGNAMSAPLSGVVITSTDSAAPAVTSTTATAVAGALNDTVSVVFDDYMVQSEVETSTFWSVESPIGTSLDTTSCTVSYNSVTRQATLTFDASTLAFFRGGDNFSVTLSTMSDISNNTLTSAPMTGSVSYETGRPYADAAHTEAALNTTVTVYFSEHMDYLTDLYSASTNVDGTRYLVRDNGGAVRGLPSAASVLDNGLGVYLTFGFVINSTDTIDVMGATDLVGNYMFPALGMPLATEDTDEVAIALPGAPLVAVSGERNDTIQIVFDRNINPWGATDPANYDISTGGNSLDLSNATFTFDGADTVDILLDGAGANSLQASSTYNFSVDNLLSDQGVAMTAASTALNVSVSGDTTTGPVVGAGNIFVDGANSGSLLVYASEALDPTLAEDEGRWNWDGGTLPTLATLIGPSTVRLSFASNPIAGSVLAYEVVDLAGNNPGASFDAALASETNPPALITTGATAVAGAGGDYITVTFDEPINQTTGLDASNYSVDNGGSLLSISASGAWYDSTNYSVNFPLSPGAEFDTTQPLEITVSGVSDHSRNVMIAPSTLAGTITGDTSTAPGVTSAFTNFRVDPTGLLVDVLFDEDPDETFITNQFNWSVTGSGGQVVLGVLPQSDGAVYRIVLTGALSAGEELEIATAMPDLAGNVTGSATTVTVTE